jgi:hypothetical protein
LEFSIDRDNWLSEYISADHFASAETWKLTRAFVVVRKTKVAPVKMSLAVYAANGPDAPYPTNVPLGTPAVLTSDVLNNAMTFQWQEFVFPDVEVKRAGNQGICLVLAADDTGIAAQYMARMHAPATGVILMYTDDGGKTWGPEKARQSWYDMKFYLYGAPLTEQQEQTTRTDRYLTGLLVTLRASEGGRVIRVDTGTHVINEPLLETIVETEILNE